MTQPDPIEQQAEGIMRVIDRRIGRIETEWHQKRAISLLGAVLERVEVALDAAKEETYGD